MDIFHVKPCHDLMPQEPCLKVGLQGSDVLEGPAVLLVGQRHAPVGVAGDHTGTVIATVQRIDALRAALHLGGLKVTAVLTEAQIIVECQMIVEDVLQAQRLHRVIGMIMVLLLAVPVLPGHAIFRDRPPIGGPTGLDDRHPVIRDAVIRLMHHLKHDGRLRSQPEGHGWRNAPAMIPDMVPTHHIVGRSQPFQTEGRGVVDPLVHVHRATEIIR
ncbi:hypothetical protein SACS_0399 [Parasaccharibacter apium]|uniref:Uncharacterized protein n=1 Tax=Parasaccharibacter apium TaxID=1510841 RepID=A0A7U7G4U0_9PROT|nr:hypothetical protein SACS_0399 [Parasaccharibacter apium]